MVQATPVPTNIPSPSLPHFTSDEQLLQLSAKNPELRFERNSDGSLVTMAPTGGISGNREIKAGSYLFTHVDGHDLGEVFSSSTGFKLPNEAVRSPDVAFVAKGRLPEDWDQREDEYVPLAPDFAIEIRSKNDSLSGLQAKMQEYVEQGVRLGWLIDRQHKTAYVYRANGTVTQCPEGAVLTGEDVVPGFALALKILL